MRLWRISQNRRSDGALNNAARRSRGSASIDLESLANIVFQVLVS